MEDSYSVNTTKFSLDKLRDALKTKYILPGRKVLKEQLDERFDLLKSEGIESLFDLLDALKSKIKIEQFASKTGLDTDYLTILRREANSYVSVPVRLIDLPIVETDTIMKLDFIGIRDSKQLFIKAAQLSEREQLAANNNIQIEALTELVQLSDLIRITGVGPVFARIILDSGIGSVEEFLVNDPEDLFVRLTKTNNEKGLTKVKFTRKDIEYCIELGKDLPIVFER